MSGPSPALADASRRSTRPFRRAVLRGLGVVLPPLLTIVILLWIWNTVKYYVLEPVTAGSGVVLSWALTDVRNELPGAVQSADDDTVFIHEDTPFKRLPNGTFIPLEVYRHVLRTDGIQGVVGGGQKIYSRYVQLQYLRPIIVVPIFVIVFVLMMYVLGSLFAAGLGEVWIFFENAFSRLPVIRNVYGSVKQVTDFVLSENELEFTRVVAVEYPCRGVWAPAFVTGEGMQAVSAAAGEPVLSLLVPTSPVPVTGYTLMVPKSEVLDLDMTVDQAIQFIISCGVVLPEEYLRAKIQPPV